MEEAGVKEEGRKDTPAGCSWAEEVLCLCCGYCCGPYFSLYVDEEDEKRWQEEGAEEILARLEWERERVRWDEAGPYNVETGERLWRCVFLVPGRGGTWLCAIHFTKPKICRQYPPGSSELCVRFRPRQEG